MKLISKPVSESKDNLQTEVRGSKRAAARFNQESANHLVFKSSDLKLLLSYRIMQSNFAPDDDVITYENEDHRITTVAPLDEEDLDLTEGDDDPHTAEEDEMEDKTSDDKEDVLDQTYIAVW